MRPRYGKVRKHCGPREIKKARRFVLDVRTRGRIPFLLETTYNIGSSPKCRRIMDAWLAEGWFEPDKRDEEGHCLILLPVRRIGRDVHRFADVVKIKGVWSQNLDAIARGCYHAHYQDLPLPIDPKLWASVRPARLTTALRFHPELRDAFKAADRLGVPDGL